MLYVEARNAAREYRDYRVWPLGRRNERLRERRSPDLDGDERAETEREGDEHPEMALARGAPRRRLERSHRKRGLEREQSAEERDERRRYDARGDAGDSHGSAGRECLGIARNVDAERRERGKSADGKPAEGEEQRLFRDKLRDAKAREADHPEDRELAAARLDGKKERVDEQAQRRERGGPEKKALRAVHVAPRVGHEHRRGLLCRDRLKRLPVLVDLRDGGGREEHVGIAAHRTLPFDEARDPDAVCALPADEGQLVADRGEVLDAALGEERLRHQCAVDPLSYGGEGNHRRPLQNAAVGTEIELELHALRARLDGNRGEHPLRHRHGLAVVRRDERLHEHDGSDGRRDSERRTDMSSFHPAPNPCTSPDTSSTPSPHRPLSHMRRRSCRL